MVLDLILVHFFPLTNFDWVKNVVIFRVDSSLSVHIDYNKMDILSFVKVQHND